MGKMTPVRVSPEFREICNLIKAKAILAGKRPPSIASISKYIAQYLRKNGNAKIEDILNDVYIRFK